MTLGAPIALVALLVLPLLWWLSLPPRPRVFTWTAHLPQWQAALAALRRRPPRFAALRFVLLALAASAWVLALAAPSWPGQPGAERLVVVLDGSASMAARSTGGESAWQRATASLQRQLKALPPAIDVTLLVPGADLRRRHGDSARSLHDLGAPAGALASDLEAVVAQALAVPRTAVWTLTDGQGQTALPGRGALSVLPAAGDNAAIVAVRAEDRWPLPELRLEVDVVAFTAGPVEAVLQLAGPIRPQPNQPVQLLGERPQTLTLDCVREPAGGELVLTLALPGDVLPGDDRFVLRLPALPAPRIAVLTEAESGPFAAVAAAELAREVGGEVVAPAAAEPVGLLLVDGGVAELVAGRQRALTFGTRLGAATGELPAGGQPLAIDWDRRLPLVAGLDLSELRIQQAWPSLLPPGQVFLWGEQLGERVPLGVIAGDDRLASLHLAFRLGDSNLPLLAAFPQLLRRAFVRSYGATAQLVAATSPPPAGELDLRAPAAAADRPLPEFATPAVDLAPWAVLVGICALALRALVR
jgi:hypothetical protein